MAKTYEIGVIPRDGTGPEEETDCCCRCMKHRTYSKVTQRVLANWSPLGNMDSETCELGFQ